MRLSPFLLFLSLLLIKNDSVSVMAQDTNRRWRLVFHDEFNQRVGHGIDTTKWGNRDRANNIWARWIANNPKTLQVRKGRLVCRAVPNTDLNTDTAKMQTGVITSQDRFAFQYGKVEVRMRTNAHEGNFPAVWMRPQTPTKDYRYGEIDVVEFFGADQIARQTVHSERTTTLKMDDEQTRFQTHVKATQWHVYGVEWHNDHITFTIDGKTTGTLVKSTDPDKLAEGQWTFDRPFYLIINQSVGRKGWHEPDITKTYQTEIDWVRVYQQN